MTQLGQGSRAALISAAHSQAVFEVLVLSGERLTRAEELLLRPTTHSVPELIDTLEECCELLSGLDAGLRARSTEDLAPDLDPGRAALAGAARQWQRSLQRLAHLTAGASSFCNGWASMAGYLPAYTPAGAAPATEGGSQLDRLG